MTPQKALTKIIADVAPDAATQAYINMHLTMARGEFRKSFQRAKTAATLRKLGNSDGLAAKFDASADHFDESAEKHLRLAMDAQSGVVL